MNKLPAIIATSVMAAGIFMIVISALNDTVANAIGRIVGFVALGFIVVVCAAIIWMLLYATSELTIDSYQSRRKNRISRREQHSSNFR